MQLCADAFIPFPRPRVWEVYRDRLAELVPYLPNIRRIEVRSREEQDAIVRLVNHWQGGGELPKLARAALREEMLSWTDRACWDSSDFCCDWRIETHAFAEAVRCSGCNRYLEERAGTRLEIRGALEIDGRNLRGVPRFLAARVGRVAEEFLVRRIEPNLVAVSNGVRRYLETAGISYGQ